MCLAHAAPEAISAGLTPGGGVDLDGRGARFDRAAVARILAAVPTDGSGRRLLGTVCFDQATFDHSVSFDEATFTGPVSMVDTTFRGGARFGGARFGSTADFRGAAFSGQAWYVGASFDGAATFEGARFLGPGWFQRAIFSGAACFDATSFSANATFTNARFAEKGSFRAASFEGHARFGGATAERGWDLEDTRLHLEGEGPQDAPPPEPVPPPPLLSTAAGEPIAPQRPYRPPRRPVLRNALVPLLVVLFIAATGFVVLRPDNPEADYVPELVEPKGYDFLHEDPITRVVTRYNPCEPIRYVVNTASGPPGWTEELRAAVAVVAEATGITFQEVGDTTERIRPDLPEDMRQIFGWPAEVQRYGQRFQEIFARPSYQPTRYGERQWSPILVAWVSFGDLDLPYGTQIAGVGASEPRRSADGRNAYVSGALILNADAPIHDLRLVIMHELGHILGLAHVNDETELMNPTFESQTGFGPGDLEGLRLVGRDSGCVVTPPAGR